jgi:branched-chain amino acid transport system substrate-binding protein
MSHLADHIRVGMPISLSGRYAPQGQQALIGIQTWIEDTNRRGGIQVGEQVLPVRLIYYDDASDAAQCGILTERLITVDRVDILLGPYSSGLALRAGAVANHHQHVLWNHGGALETASTPGPGWVIGLLTPAPRYFVGIIDLVWHTSPAAPRMAIIYSTAGAFPQAVAAGSVRHSQDRGFETVRMYPYPARTTDFTSILAQLANDPPHLLLSVGRIEDDLHFARQYVRSPLRAKVVGLIVTPLTLFRDTLGNAAGLFLGPSQWEPGIVSKPDYGPTAAEILQRLTAYTPHDVDYPMAQAYAGGLVAQRCVEAAGTLEQHALWRAAHRLDFTTFYGRYRLEPSTGRQVGHHMPVVQWQGDRKVILWPPQSTPG